MKKRTAWEMAVGAPKKVQKFEKFSNILRDSLQRNNSQNITQIQIERQLNPLKYHLSDEAKKRLRWMYIIHCECDGNITKGVNKVGKSRQWLSFINSKWKKNNKDPRSLEPENRAPKNTDNRKKIDKSIEDTIVKIRTKHHWGKDKLETVLERYYNMKAGATSINRILEKHGLLDIKISNKNKIAYKNKVEQKQRVRPPKEIKDYKPGALIEKDMKFIPRLEGKRNFDKPKAKENFNIQHTILDSFTRIRVLELAEGGGSEEAKELYEKAINRLPFDPACVNNDNDSENMGEFEEYLKEKNVVHFFSRPGKPTDNPRVERSHLTDEVEFYQHGGIKQTFQEQQSAMLDQEYIYNYVRPHQALANKTPMEFYLLWKQDPEEAYRIRDRWQAYLRKQSERLAVSRRMKKKDKIEKLMQQIDIRLNEENPVFKASLEANLCQINQI